MSRIRVVEVQEPENKRPVRFQVGDRVQVNRADPDDPSWLWVQGPDGRQGWVARPYLSGHTGEMSGLRNYDGTELAVRPGDTGTALEELAGWRLCLLDDGRRGWIRSSNLEEL